MIIVKNIKSTIKPDEIDDSNNDKVYVRSNIIESIEVDPVFNKEYTIYTYDEIQYSLPEWNKLAITVLKEEQEKMNEKILEILDILKEK